MLEEASSAGTNEKSDSASKQTRNGHGAMGKIMKMDIHGYRQNKNADALIGNAENRGNAELSHP